MRTQAKRKAGVKVGGEEQAWENAKKGSKNACSIWESFSLSLNIFTALSRLSVYLQKRSTDLLEIIEEGIENDTMQVKAGLCVFASACTDGISNFLPRCVF